LRRQALPIGCSPAIGEGVTMSSLEMGAYRHSKHRVSGARLQITAYLQLRPVADIAAGPSSAQLRQIAYIRRSDMIGKTLDSTHRSVEESAASHTVRDESTRFGNVLVGVDD
jgi:hypothetical protein